MNTKIFHAVALTITLALAGASWADEKKVVILQVNDVYKTFPIMPENLGGFARLKKLVDTAKKNNPGAAFVLSGDFLSPSLVSRESKGESMVESLNLIGLDIASLGNHEFDYGLDALRMRINESGKEGQFPWLNSNAWVEGKLLPGTVESFVLDINGVKVGFFGILGPDTHPSSIHKCTAKGGIILGGYEKNIYAIRNQRAGESHGVAQPGMELRPYSL